MHVPHKCLPYLSRKYFPSFKYLDLCSEHRKGARNRKEGRDGCKHLEMLSAKFKLLSLSAFHIHRNLEANAVDFDLNL